MFWLFARSLSREQTLTELDVQLPEELAQLVLLQEQLKLLGQGLAPGPQTRPHFQSMFSTVWKLPHALVSQYLVENSNTG